MKTAVYVEGLNLYHGLAKPLNCKWVNLQSYFDSQFGHDEIAQIYFFQAIVNGPAQKRQLMYFKALQTLERVTIIEGRMKQKDLVCQVSSCRTKPKFERTYVSHEEKETDVAIAVQMVHDAHQKQFEKMILVTADTDLLPAVKIVRSANPNCHIKLLIPALAKERYGGAQRMKDSVDSVSHPSVTKFVSAQFPKIVRQQPLIEMPDAWSIITQADAQRALERLSQR